MKDNKLIIAALIIIILIIIFAIVLLLIPSETPTGSTSGFPNYTFP